jgi:hypothetical protein
MNHHKHCPSCNKIIWHSSKKCRKCAKKGLRPAFMKNGKIPRGILIKISKTWFKKGQRPESADFRRGKTYEEIYGVDKAKEVKRKLSEVVMSAESNKRRSESCIKAKCGYCNKGRKTSNKLKRLFRKQTIERLSKTHKNFHPSYSINACKYFDEVMKSTGHYIQHALNGGEYHIKDLGYWLDGYDKANNVVYEWDERRHFNNDGTLKNKDILREKEIKRFLKCQVIRIKDPRLFF